MKRRDFAIVEVLKLINQQEEKQLMRKKYQQVRNSPGNKVITSVSQSVCGGRHRGVS